MRKSKCKKIYALHCQEKRLQMARGPNALQLQWGGWQCWIGRHIGVGGKKTILKEKRRFTQVDLWNLEVGFGWLALALSARTSSHLF